MNALAHYHRDIDHVLAGVDEIPHAVTEKLRGDQLTVTIDNLVKAFGDTPALHGVSLDIAGGELIALLGPSGSGKTTLLRLIAGLEFPSAGRILFGEDDASAKSVQERNVGFVFQHYALFKHMTVFENIAFGLRVRPHATRPDEAVIRKRVMTLLELVQLGGLEKRYPVQLSGGQRQRVALARALAIAPRILLLDEPFGALDAKVRKELRRWLREIHDRTGHTTVFVTHDQEEALELADRVVVMNQGRIEQVGSADDIYDRPATPFVFDFIGDSSALPVTVDKGHVYLDDLPLSIDARAHRDGAATLFFRPGHVKIAGQEGGAITGIVSGSRRIGDIRRLELETGLARHRFEIDVPLDVDVQKNGRLAVQLTNWRLFPAT
ncbi:MAG: sulfate/molybdate ABC transporter ATP-binding protein [Pseudorhodoplanes sp.]|jgi:sulfate transport system ATP-binding protein|nr:sulfate/molybdate ABC transporter ATP-binding protein [Pseudorhodoplanes sp.]